MIEDQWIWPFVHGLGRLFLKYASEFKNYGDYAENFMTSRITLQNIIANKKHRLREVFEVFQIILFSQTHQRPSQLIKKSSIRTRESRDWRLYYYRPSNVSPITQLF